MSAFETETQKRMGGARRAVKRFHDKPEGIQFPEVERPIVMNHVVVLRRAIRAVPNVAEDHIVAVNQGASDDRLIGRPVAPIRRLDREPPDRNAQRWREKAKDCPLAVWRETLQ